MSALAALHQGQGHAPAVELPGPTHNMCPPGLGKLQIVKSLGLDIDDAELQDMIAEFDLDKKGAVNIDEFLSIMNASD